MTTTPRARTLALTAALAAAGVLGGRPASAQNTYLDVPFNQGSLFYRPSGAKPPATTTPSRPAGRGLFRRAPRYRYAAPARYVAPGTPYYAPQTGYYYVR